MQTVVAYLASAIRPDFCCIDNGHSSACGDKVDPSIYVTCYVGPNITGDFTVRNYWIQNSSKESESVGLSSGSFSHDAKHKAFGPIQSPNWQPDMDSCSKVTLNASKGNALYNGTKLQSPALQLLACIRC